MRVLCVEFEKGACATSIGLGDLARCVALLPILVLLQVGGGRDVGFICGVKGCGWVFLY